MAYYFPNVDPTYIVSRKGTEDDPFLHLVEENYISKKAIVLREIPSIADSITVIDSNNNELTKTENEELNPNEYRVDYTTGALHFHESREGEKMIIDYFGKGFVHISTSRIWKRGDEDEPLESLHDALQNVEEGLQVLEQMGSLEFKGDYNSSLAYKKWNFVTHNNKTYVAIRDSVGVSPTDTSYWKLVSSGVGFAGIYDDNKTYDIGDIVTDAEKKNLYMSKINNNTSLLSNSQDWEVLLTLDDTVTNLVNIIDQKIDELDLLKTQLLNEENIRQQNEVNRDNTLNNAIQSLEDFKQDLLDDEDIRNNNELIRENNENQRVSQENIRESNEQARSLAEQTRQLQETARQDGFNNALDDINDAISQTNTAINQINDLIFDVTDLKDQAQTVVHNAQNITSDLQEFINKGEYNPSETYYKYNIVSFNGSSYIALQETQGDSVDDTFYWQLLSERGRDGDMITVNGIEADEDGNIDLGELDFANIDDVEASVNQAKNEIESKIGDLALLKTLNKSSLIAAINELHNKINDIIDVLTTNE